MRYIVEIDTENDAFKADPVREVAAILRRLSFALEYPGTDPNLRVPVVDSNGNRVGTARFEE